MQTYNTNEMIDLLISIDHITIHLEIFQYYNNTDSITSSHK